VARANGGIKDAFCFLGRVRPIKLSVRQAANAADPHSAVHQLSPMVLGYHRQILYYRWTKLKIAMSKNDAGTSGAIDCQRILMIDGKFLGIVFSPRPAVPPAKKAKTKRHGYGRVTAYRFFQNLQKLHHKSHKKSIIERNCKYYLTLS